MEIRDPVEELISTKSWQYLNMLDRSSAENVIVFLSHTSSILSTIRSHFPYYTRHDAHHGFQVISRIEQILKPDCFLKDSAISLSATEVFLLICASYAHDLGMTVFPSEKTELLTQLNIPVESGWELNPILQKFLRDKHSTRGGDYINRNADNIGISRNLIYPLHQLMKSHNLSIGELDTEFKDRVAAENTELDLKQLSCILCIADAIEFSDTRVIEGVLGDLKSKNEPNEIESYRENMKHFCINNSVAIGNDGKIIFSGTFSDPDILNLAHKTVDLIEDWVRSYCDIDFSSNKRRLQIRSDSISRSFKSLDFDFERLGIRIKKENIINLISSNSLWSNGSLIPIRELLQNSVEACRYRAYHSSLSDNYLPSVNITVKTEQNIIIINDNGCGMSRNIILNNFLTVGNSRSFDPTYLSKDFKSLSRFGIGFWSIFTIAQRCHIETASFEQLQFNNLNNDLINGIEFDISISEFKDYTTFITKKRPPGTSIVLYLKDDTNINNLVSSIHNVIVCSDIPISIAIDVAVLKIPKIPRLPTTKELLGSRYQFSFENYLKEYNYSETLNEYTFQYKIYYLKAGLITFNIIPFNTLSGAKDMISGNYVSFSICGFPIALRLPESVFLGTNVGVLIVNSSNPDGFEFSIDRRNLIENNQYYLFQTHVQKLLYKAYRAFLKDLGLYNAKDIFRLNKEARNTSKYSHFRLTDNLKHSIDLYSDLLCFELIEVIIGKNFNEIPRKYYSILELIDEDIQVITVLSHLDLDLKNVDYRNFEEVTNHYLYLIISSCKVKDVPIYYHIPCFESMLLYCNNPLCEIHLIDIIEQNANKRIQVPIIKFNPSLTAIDGELSNLLGYVEGMWVGVIFKNIIKGANFVFIQQQYLSVNRDSVLCEEIEILFSKGKIREISILIHRLLELKFGYVDESIKKYF